MRVPRGESQVWKPDRRRINQNSTCSFRRGPEARTNVAQSRIAPAPNDARRVVIFPSVAHQVRTPPDQFVRS